MQLALTRNTLGCQNALTAAMTAGDPLQLHTEDELVDQFRATSENVYFEALYQAARRKVFSVCFRILRNAASAEDITHEAFLRAYERFRTLEGNNFSAWVCRIAANLCLNSIRDQRTRERLLLDQAFVQGPADEPVTAERGAIHGEESGIALEVIESLAPEQKKVLLLRCVEGCSYNEIERITGYDSGQVRSYLQNARRNFQIRWQNKVGSAEGKQDGAARVRRGIRADL